MGNVYVIHAVGTDRYKIGMTLRDVDYRVREISTSCPFELSIVTSVEFEDCALVEKFLHEEFAHQRVTGEWFQMTDVSPLLNAIFSIQKGSLTVSYNQAKVALSELSAKLSRVRSLMNEIEEQIDLIQSAKVRVEHPDVSKCGIDELSDIISQTPSIPIRLVDIFDEYECDGKLRYGGMKEAIAVLNNGEYVVSGSAYLHLKERVLQYLDVYLFSLNTEVNS